MDVICRRGEELQQDTTISADPRMKADIIVRQIDRIPGIQMLLD
jgi:hypothetical protein